MKNLMQDSVLLCILLLRREQLHRVAEAEGIEVSECSSSEGESSEYGSSGNSSKMVVTAASDTTEDNRVETAAPDASGLKDFESAIAVVQHSRTAELRWSALANTARR